MTDIFLEKGLPQEVEAERGFLGPILMDPNLISQASTLLPAEDLFLDSHRRIYRAMIALAATGQVIDLVTLSSELRKNGEFEQVGGATYIASLIDGMPRESNLKPYSKLIKEAALKRQLITTCNQAIFTTYDSTDTFAEIIQKVEAEIFKLAKSDQRGTGPQHVSTVSAQLVGYYEQKTADPSKLIGLSTGYEDLDRQTLGLTEGLNLIAARPSMGKTALGINIACNVAIRGGGSVFFASLESGAKKIVQRILASEARVDSLRMRSGFMNRQEWSRLHDALASLTITRFVVDDTPDLTPSELSARCRQYQSEHGLDLIVVDYLQLMARRLQVIRRYRDLRSAVQEVGADMVSLSRDLGVPVVGIAQTSRVADDRPGHRPQMSDLAESASLEQDADLVLFLLRDEQYRRTDENRGRATLIFGKQRDGGTDQDITMAFFKEFTRFESLDRDYWPVQGPTLEERREAARHRSEYMSRSHDDDNDD